MQTLAFMTCTDICFFLPLYVEHRHIWLKHLKRFNWHYILGYMTLNTRMHTF